MACGIGNNSASLFGEGRGAGRLLQQGITVRLETMQIMRGLSEGVE